MNKKYALYLTLALLSATSLSTPAFAVCPHVDGNETGTCHLNAGDDLLVDAGASVITSSNTAVEINTNQAAGTLVNYGTIQSGSSYAILFDDDSSAVSLTNHSTGQIFRTVALFGGASITGGIVNDGLMSATGERALELSGLGSLGGGISNNGTIQATGAQSFIYGIYATGGFTINGGITNAATGTISGGVASQGIFLNSGSVLNGGIHNLGDGTNGGTISGGLLGVHVGNASSLNGDIINDEFATISGDNAGILIDGVSSVVGNINNSGTIEARGNAMSDFGIQLMGTSSVTGDIVNQASGVVRGLRIDNSTVGGKIENYGTINDSNILGAVLISYPTSHITFDNYGTINGTVAISNTTLNLNTGTVLSQGISSSNSPDSVININTDLSTIYTWDAGTVNLTAGHTLSANSLFQVSDAFNNNGGTLNIGNSPYVAIMGDYNQNAAATLAVTANSASDYGKLDISGTGTFAANTGIFVNAATTSVTDSDTLAGVITAGTLNATTFNVTDNSTLFNFSALINGNAVDLLAAAASATGVETATRNEGNNPGIGAAKVLDQIIASSPGGDMDNVINALGTLTSDKEVSDAVSQTLPTLTGGSTTAIMQTMNTTSQIIQARQGATEGLSSGDGFITAKAMWLKPFGTWANQGAKDGVTGYDADTFGMIGGLDGDLNDKTRLGVAFAYAKSNVNSDDGFNGLDIDSYQATVYGSYGLDNRTEVNFQTGFGFNQNDSNRIVNFGGLDRRADGDYNSYSFNIGTGIGRVYDIGQRTTFAPAARLDYNFIHNESYTETGAGGLSLDVKSQNADQLIPAVSAKVIHKLDKSFEVSANAGVGYDLLNDRNSVTSSYVGGGASFVTEGLESSPWIVRSGLGLTYKPSDSYDVTVRYDREDRGSSFDNQTASVKLRVPF